MIGRNILALGAMFGGMPLYGGVPRRQPEPPPRHQAAAELAVELGYSYQTAELVWMRYGTERARDVLTVCREHALEPDNDILRLLFDTPAAPAGEEMQRLLAAAQHDINAFKKAKTDTAALLRPAIPEARPQRRSLAERKARRAKRKQKGKR